MIPMGTQQYRREAIRSEARHSDDPVRLEWLSQDWNLYYHLASNPNTPPAVLEKMAFYDTVILRRVLRNPSAPTLLRLFVGSYLASGMNYSDFKSFVGS